MVRVVWNPSRNTCMGKSTAMTKLEFIEQAKSEYLRLTGFHLKDKNYTVEKRADTDMWILYFI